MFHVERRAPVACMIPPEPDRIDEEYELLQMRRDREWREAWEKMPAEQRAQLEKGMLSNPEWPVQIDKSRKLGPDGRPRYGRPLLETAHADADDESRMAVGRDEDVEQTAESHPVFHGAVDMAAACDRYEDLLCEHYGLSEETAKAIADDVRRFLKRAESETNADITARIAGFMILGDENPLAKAHGLIHAVPGMAELSGIKSLHESSRICRKAGVKATTEWIRKIRNRWCEILGVPVPASGAKTEEAKQSYKLNAKTNHPTKQTYGKKKQP